mmetsp:Transcript_3205/g.9184  ORF Transcript_3205/g.9184 Transcript_3205/m.9184 type:complete len:410 (-) Transcript_3205:152-1381(-)|eukprot:CAMPEP_0181056328 /NCGR_PEP_ID=MMETSP1070-20121207/19670_1 /TAXON_ID=265543 /ORGANISM="Minutocellus polymorphus, Strain NH13" /LENGTH=409 /DNA_ID=CAMNT_0023135691 /DNA_START=105 /DNA_END=1334 /DNA_ORIENTATION=-
MWHTSALVETTSSARRCLVILCLASASTLMLCRPVAAFGHVSIGRQSLGVSSFDGVGLNRPSASVSAGGVVANSNSAETEKQRRRTATLLFAASDDLDMGVFDPFNANVMNGWDDLSDRDQVLITVPDSLDIHHRVEDSNNGGLAAPLFALSVVNMAVAERASAAGSVVSQGMYNPDTFRPVCSASDGFYRFLQGATRAVVGDESFVEYGPLIAGGLLRVRLELCVVESFFNEAVGPFIKQNGLNWILPLHETVETFIAGTIFALATTFIMVGSTKLISVIALYGDVFIGGPCRLFGGFFFDRALGKPVTLDVGVGPWKKRLVGPPDAPSSAEDGSGSGDLSGLENLSPAQIPVVAVSGVVKYLGEGSKILREGVEALDLFVGRYLVVLATGYILLKFVHFKVFPDFPF